MKSKPFLVIGSIIVAIIFLTAACSAGFAAGSAFGATASSAAFQSIPFLGEAITTEAEVQTQAVTPEELEELLS